MEQEALTKLTSSRTAGGVALSAEFALPKGLRELPPLGPKLAQVLIEGFDPMLDDFDVWIAGKDEGTHLSRHEREIVRSFWIWMAQKLK